MLLFKWYSTNAGSEELPVSSPPFSPRSDEKEENTDMLTF